MKESALKWRLKVERQTNRAEKQKNKELSALVQHLEASLRLSQAAHASRDGELAEREVHTVEHKCDSVAIVDGLRAEIKRLRSLLGSIRMNTGIFLDGNHRDSAEAVHRQNYATTETLAGATPQLEVYNPGMTINQETLRRAQNGRPAARLEWLYCNNCQHSWLRPMTPRAEDGKGGE